MSNKDLSELINYLHHTGKLDVKAVINDDEVELHLKVMQSPVIIFKTAKDNPVQTETPPITDARSNRAKKSK